MLNGCLAAISLFHFVTAPVIDMRETPSSSSEVVSQVYFSEEVQILDQNGDWVKIEVPLDHYHGWIKSGNLCHRPDKFPALSAKKIAKVNRCMAHLYHVSDTVYGPLVTLPFESLLEVIDEGDNPQGRWIKVLLVDGREAFIQRGDVTFQIQPISRSQLPQFSLQFLGLPYTWGGRSSFGYDCSGFVQMLYRQIGLHIPRDSRQQIKWEGFKEIAIKDVSPGDLVFFGVDETKISHVGMCLDSEHFINATVAENAPYIHISNLSDPTWNGSGRLAYKAARTLKEEPTNR